MQTQSPTRPKYHTGWRPIFAIILALVFPALLSSLQAQQSMTASWNPNPEPDIAGYKVYLGTSSRNYSTVKDVTSGTSVVLSGLAPATTYYCAVQAYNTSGLMSELSDEVSKTTAAATAPEIAVRNSAGSGMASGTDSISLGSVILETSGRSETLTITNQGTANLTGLAITTEGPDSADFVVSSTGAATLTPGTSASFAVTFHPTATGSRRATLKIASNDADENPFQIALEGEGAPEPVVTSPEIGVFRANGTELNDGSASADFGSLDPGTSGIVQSFSILNSGTAALSVLTLAVDGGNAADFSVSTLAGSTIAAGASATFDVTFRPGATGARTASLHITSNDADESPFDIALAGTGTVGPMPEIALKSPFGTDLQSGSATLSFGSIHLQTTAAQQTLTIHNQGSTDLTGLAQSISGDHPSDFAATPLQVTSLSPGASTTITVTFNPAAAGVRRSSLHITSNDSDESPFVVSLAGNGIATPDIDVTFTDGGNLAEGNTPNDFGQVNLGRTGTARSFTIRNRGTSDLTIPSIYVTGKHRADFILQGPESTTLAPGNETTFTAAFQPGAAGERVAKLVIQSNDPDENPFEIAVSGVGLADPEIEVTATGIGTLTDGAGSIDFGSVNSGSTGTSQIVTIRNTGSGNLTGLKLALQGAHAADFKASALGKRTLGPGLSTSFKIAFLPGGSGNRTATLAITSNDADEGEFKIGLVGYSNPASDIEIRVTDGAKLADGDAFVSFGTSGGTRIFTVTNRGNANLTNLSIQRSGLHKEDFATTRIKTKSLAPGKSTTFKVTFTARAKGTRWAAVKIKSNDPDTDSFDIVLTGKAAGSSSAKSTPVAKASPIPATASGKLQGPVVSVMIVKGLKYRCITISKRQGTGVNPRSVEVSGNLVDWSGGRNHITVVKDNATLLKVRDNTPLTPGSKRFIRLRKRG